jgi:hypothetical protein
LLRGMAEGLEDLFYEPYQVGLKLNFYSFSQIRPFLIIKLIMKMHNLC